MHRTASTPRSIPWLKDAKNGRAAARYRSTPGSRNADNGFRVVAATRATAAASPVAPATPPANGAPAIRTPDQPTRSKNSALGGCIIGVGCLGTLGLISWLMVVIFRGRKNAVAGPGAPPPLTHRLANDGFWIDAPRHLAGSLVHYRYRDQNAQIHEGEVRLDGAASGQYVYTGQPPLAVLALQIVEATRGSSTQSRSSWSSSQQQQSRHHSATSSTQTTDDSTFRGYPSAY